MSERGRLRGPAAPRPDAHHLRTYVTTRQPGADPGRLSLSGTPVPLSPSMVERDTPGHQGRQAHHEPPRDGPVTYGSDRQDHGQMDDGNHHEIPDHGSVP
ncbi:hypothetical protein [Streptomyces sp. bgisy022]|uniref:hypothetical protein n=1 Tax=Streptomyces sp. bgisy022 TaxID=3413769 RepID=UPI003D74ABDE